jgi:hypothetical protein
VAELARGFLVAPRGDVVDPLAGARASMAYLLLGQLDTGWLDLQAPDMWRGWLPSLLRSPGNAEIASAFLVRSIGDDAGPAEDVLLGYVERERTNHLYIQDALGGYWSARL